MIPIGDGLGLFVLGHVVFLFGYNLLDIADEGRKYLKKQRDFWLEAETLRNVPR